ARAARPQADRCAGGLGAVYPPVRTMARSQLHRRRAYHGARGPVHGRDGRQAAQSRLEGLLQPPRHRRQAPDGRPHRRPPEGADRPQRHAQGQPAMAKRLTSKTVPLPLKGERECSRPSCEYSAIIGRVLGGAPMNPKSALGRVAAIIVAFAAVSLLSPARAEERKVEFKQVAPDLYFLYDFDSSNAVVLATDEGVLVT